MKRMRMQKSSLGPRGRNMGLGWVDEWIHDIFGTTPEIEQNKACLAAANAASAQWIAKASDVSKNWNPTGLYSRSQMQGIVQLTLAMLTSASNTMEKASAEPMADGARDALRMARSSVTAKFQDSMKFTAAIGEAMKQGVEVLDAPGLKAWVVSSMLKASDGITAAHYVLCQVPWFVTALAAFQRAFDKVWGATKQVLGVAAELGMAVLKIPDTVSQIWTLAKWGAIAVIGVWAYENVPKHLKGA